eukprot:m.250887 g.250887  ORF g.250887 m.250887 type:complete len:77 (-) comp26495_c0_seq4:1220-1450(-)
MFHCRGGEGGSVEAGWAVDCGQARSLTAPLTPSLAAGQRLRTQSRSSRPCPPGSASSTTFVHPPMPSNAPLDNLRP